MPNWCENRVTISGDTEDIAKFRETVEGLDHHGEDSVLSFHKLIPMPDELIDTTSPPTIKATQAEVDAYNSTATAVQNRTQAVTQYTVEIRREKYGADNWYDWATKNWGTKWQPSDIELDAEEDYLVYHFDTAWGPPEGIWAAIQEQFPKLHITWFYDEPGMQFCGYLGDK